MLVRTIQHPGVEIVESEIGSYSSTIVMNNAYVMGFTDKGPLYDFSAISTESEFTKIYGVPQTEAEKYVMFAVKSILNNGGTPIISRMPYDNKQCQTYKGIAMKWDTEVNGNSPIKDLATLNEKINTQKELSAILSGYTLSEALVALSRVKSGVSGAADSVTYTKDELIEASGLMNLDALNNVNPEELGLPSNAVYKAYEILNTTEIESGALIDTVVTGAIEDGCKVKIISSFIPYISLSTAELTAKLYLAGDKNDDLETAVPSSGDVDIFYTGTLSKSEREDYFANILNVLSSTTAISTYFDKDTLSIDYDTLTAEDYTKAKKVNGNKTLDVKALSTILDYAIDTLASVTELSSKPVYYRTSSNDLVKLHKYLSGDYKNLNISNCINTIDIVDGNENVYGWKHRTVGSVKIADLNSTKVSDYYNELVTAEDTKPAEIIASLYAIYNDPIFTSLNEENYTYLEASLLNTPEIGFKKMLNLKSNAVEINNDQYDDLVTVNKFSTVDYSISQYGQDIDDKNFIVIDKQKSVVAGDTGNIGYFITILDPFDGLKVQRLLVNPTSDTNVDEININGTTFALNHASVNRTGLDYWAYESKKAWNDIYDDLMDRMDSVEAIKNADGAKIGLNDNAGTDVKNTDNVWTEPLTGTYYEASFSKEIMKKYPRFALADIDSDAITSGERQCIIDKDYSSCVMIVVCKTAIDKTTGKLTNNIVETYFGSLFNETNPQTGRSKFIGNLINGNSDYIEFYRNDYVAAGDSAFAPAEYQQTQVPQIFIENSTELKTAAEMRGINENDYMKANGEFDTAKYNKELNKYFIWPIKKDECCIYNLSWVPEFTSFSKKESQKIIANTNNMYSSSDGTVANVAANFLVDMDRCIKFIKNIDDIPLAFVCDAGISTIAQFCDNVIWNPKKSVITGYDSNTNKPIVEKVGGWCTQPFDPDHDPDIEDRVIEDYTSCSTWRKVVEKIISIAGEIRKDCFAIIDAPRQLTLDGAAPKIRRTKFTNNFDKTIGKALRYVSGLNSSYAAGYYNWLRAVDTFSGTLMWIPPSVKLIGNYCYLNAPSINLPWLAPAGLSYGKIYDVLAVSHNPDYEEEDQIYSKSWNYIKLYPTDGFVVEGQRTLLGKPSVFERVNVRLLFLDLERYAYNVSKNYKYKVNNTYTREQYVATLTTKFSDYAARGGIYEYLIVCDETNNTPQTIDDNELRCDLFIKPARLIEFVLLSFVGTTTGTNFSELLLNS